MFSRILALLILTLAFGASGLPVPKRLDPLTDLQLQNHAQVQLAQEPPACAHGLELCSAPSQGFGVQGWQCVDVQSSATSCGGCAIPSQLSEAVGTDCTAIDGAGDVSCVMGSCRVETCTEGWAVRADGAACVRLS
ncbi:hypothetical protein CALVIDRAFT_564237 [Calocera viscosa TUFC12733]|uniref:Protein CPL1-like domain-containing protein n=1 Tax=Calocera viscosa (strain TUFC12733) TaxID=1330018 RepID=A0A167LRG7_CALVF|nr:hypothetical protein CALVIDRAFT_564237 [Calocera viscosa TUFC12733]